MTAPLADWSPKSRARIAGVFEALEGIASSYGQVLILGRLIVAGDAAATAANILAHESRFRAGFAISLAGVAFHVVWIALFYDLFKPVSRRVALLAAFVGIVTCAMQAVAAFLYLTPLLVLKGGAALAAFPPEQLPALAMTLLKLNNLAFQVDLVFFGIWCVVTGSLIYRSTFVPKVLGILLAIDGVGWMIYMSPPLGVRLFPFIATASAVAEIPLQLWLILKGVNSERWREQAAASATRA